MTKEMSFVLNLKKGEQISFALVGSVCSARDFSDPYNEAERQVIYAIHEGTTSLMAAHRSLWNELWESDILMTKHNGRFGLHFSTFILLAGKEAD